jgi:glucosamine--fructose-6-phosphate aminotransferase (isomerizing)
MCGIVGYTGPRQALSFLIPGLRRLEYRGYDSAGLATVDDRRLEVRKSVGKIGALEAMVQAAPLPGRLGIGHTRWATHGRPSPANAHPHLDCGGRLAVVHNGIIEI